jgi:tagatose 1,6-diphosphate aldolase
MPSFCFLDPGPMVERELELVRPHEKWIDPILISCAHPLSHGDDRADRTTRASLLDFLKLAPDGQQPASGRDTVPGYFFWMRLRDQFDPPVPMAGSISMRVGSTRDIELYYGHIGYNVYPPARGKHYAERACRLLRPLAAAHGMKTIWITCNPENIASRRTCERLGATFVETVRLPTSNLLYQRGEREKCRYRWEIRS